MPGALESVGEVMLALKDGVRVEGARRRVLGGIRAREQTRGLCMRSGGAMSLLRMLFSM